MLVLLSAVLVAGCDLGGDEEPTRGYVVEFTAADEDFVDFGTVASFMNGGSWTILEKVKIPAGATTSWHMFRGKAWADLEGDVAMQMRSDVDTA